MGFVQLLLSIFGNAPRQVEVIMLGLDNSGKTTILNRLKAAENPESTVPTVGQNVDKFVAADLTFNAYDMSGQSKYRNLWETHYKTIHGIVFVIDSTDKMRLALARDELWMMLDHKDIAYKKVPLLILANKADQKDALTSADVHLSLGLDMIRNRNWHIVSTCALTGQGLMPAIEWLGANIKLFLEAQ
uniref:ADP-ribosylation factor-like protein 6 n=1 Tax=Panagrolaimus sp. JU765 TaxID=591449 RepID=A0AC34Q6F3_9BILA